MEIGKEMELEKEEENKIEKRYKTKKP